MQFHEAIHKNGSVILATYDEDHKGWKLMVNGSIKGFAFREEAARRWVDRRRKSFYPG